jgi:hypothetical protein
MMNAFAQGIINNKSILLAAVEDALQDVRDMLPSSDAKRGPLSDLTASGETYWPTFVAGVRKKASLLTTAVNSALVKPSALAVRTLPAMAGAGGIGAINNYFEGTPTQVGGPTAQQAREFAKTAVREAQIQMKLRGRS